MTEFLVQLLGARVPEAADIAHASLSLRGGVGAGWVIGLLLLLAALVWVMYRQSPPHVSPRRRQLLTALRLAFVALLLLLLLRPVLALTIEGSVRRVLVLLMDSSSSMQIKDPRVEPADVHRLAIARGMAAPGSKPDGKQDKNEALSRVDVLKAALGNARLNLLPRLEHEFDLAGFQFGQTVTEIAARPQTTNANRRTEPVGVDRFTWVRTLQATNPATALGDALREVAQRKRGQPLAGIVLVSDGAQNSGVAPREVAEMLRQEGLPVYVYGVGITQPKDIIVGNLFAPDVTFVRDEAVATVRVRSQGLGGETAEVVLKMAGEIVTRQQITLAQEGEQAVSLRFTPEQQGDFDLEASVEPRADEAVKDNNARAQRLRVIDARIKVLLVDQGPRWEFRYLQAMLERDRRVDLKCYLVEGDPGISRTEDSPYLAGFPARKDELFAYDLVIFGDVDPKAISTAQMENLNELVSRFGGGLVVVAGKRFMPAAYKRTVLERVLPVDFDSPGMDTPLDAVAEKPIKLELTPRGRANPMLRLTDKDEENVSLWQQLPPVYWVARVQRAKPAAEVLLVDPDPTKETRTGKMPVVAVQQYGLGQVLYVGTDNTWRWRKNVGDLYYTTLWGQMAQRLSLQRLLGGSKRTQITTDRQNVRSGDRVSVYARLYGAGFEPVQEPVVKAVYGMKNGSSTRSEITLRSIPEQPGLYRGEFIAGAPGYYQFFVESDLNTPLDFTVTEPKFELGETAMNETLLRELATTTGGRFFREEDLHQLPDTIHARTERVRSPLEVELWASPLYFLLLLGVVSTEWVLRKRSYLK